MIKDILADGLCAPTGRNLQGVSFLVVRDPLILKKLAYRRQSRAHLHENAKAAIRVLCDSERTDLWIEDASLPWPTCTSVPMA